LAETYFFENLVSSVKSVALKSYIRILTRRKRSFEK